MNLFLANEAPDLGLKPRQHIEYCGFSRTSLTDETDFHPKWLLKSALKNINLPGITE
jgi:hypothetical protein